ncbi:N-terminal kinase-like protein isoform X2 [Patella vulgata]|nr:N-terminal kinase-like protein isoform X2 [Patella vulgata]
MAATQNYFNLQEVAQRLLPSLCGMTMDPDKGVRDQSFKAIKGFIAKLEKVSENPELLEDMEREVMTGGSAGGGSGWAGWAVTGMTSLTSKIYSKATTARPANKPGVENRTSPPKQTAPSTTASNQGETTPKPSMNYQQPEEVEEEEETGGDDDWGNSGWGDMDESDVDGKDEVKVSGNDGWDDGDEDDWGSLEDPTPTSINNKSSKSSKGGKSGEWGDWGDDFVSTEGSGLPSASSYNWGQTENTDDFFSANMSKEKPRSRQGTPVRKTTPPRQNPDSSMPAKPKLSTSQSTPPKSVDGWEVEESGWGEGDGWNNDSWATGSNKSDDKQRREEKKLQRQRELQEKREARKASGAMKLGAKKMAQS